MNKVYHVSKKGNDSNVGSQEAPFLTISMAANIAEEGDTVIVHEGVYREWIKPNNGGFDEWSRITYKAMDGEKVVIKGSEEVTEWDNVDGTIWKTTLSNQMFGEYNPYVKTVDGDWCAYPKQWKVHVGDVYMNGKSFYEAQTMDELREAKAREYFVFPLNERKEYYKKPEDTIYLWYCEVTDSDTVIYANFHGVNPNEVFTEVNVRQACFFPDKLGVNYITISGFEFAHAACPWAPPTGDQIGMVGPKWSKGWIIENNVLHDAKCSAISIGKEKSTGDELSYKRKNKPGYHYQMESVFDALRKGWSKDLIGSHIVRNNIIYDCGQNGIVGHMGCVFSEIYGNRIYNIGVKHEFFGYEIAAIKLHAAIDVSIIGNCIYDTTLGIWLDWQAQGTRLSRNLFFANERDAYIEVTHGPMLVDNNIFASAYALDNYAQGTAFVNNIFNGFQSKHKVLDRATPYHLPHSTEVKGYAFVHSGDDRYYNNIFVKRNVKEDDENCFYGMKGYENHTRSLEQYTEEFQGENNDHKLYFEYEQPVYHADNSFYGGAEVINGDAAKYVTDFECNIEIFQESDEIFMEMSLDKGALEKGKIYDTNSLGRVRIVDTRYETPLGKFLSINQDYYGRIRAEKTSIGSFEDIKEGRNRYCVWPNK